MAYIEEIGGVISNKAAWRVNACSQAKILMTAWQGVGGGESGIIRRKRRRHQA